MEQSKPHKIKLVPNFFLIHALSFHQQSFHKIIQLGHLTLLVYFVISMLVHDSIMQIC